MEFLERNGINVLPPLPKYPLAASDWTPYNSMDNFCERISCCSPASPMGQAVRAVAAARASHELIAQAFARLAAVDGSSPPQMRQRAHGQCREILQNALDPLIGDPVVMRAIDAALPDGLPVPDRAVDEIELLPDRTIWQFRLLYGLVVGLHEQRMEIRATWSRR